MTNARTYAELKADYFFIPPNSSRDRKHRLYRKAGRHFIAASASMDKLIALANEDAAYVAGVQQAEG